MFNAISNMLATTDLYLILNFLILAKNFPTKDMSTHGLAVLCGLVSSKVSTSSLQRQVIFF